MSSRDEESRSDTPEIDYSVIRTAIKIGGRVIDQVLNGVHYGSAEVRSLLFEECDVILECKVCRNLFRGLPNLVAHKRVYCTDTYDEHKRKENELAAVESDEAVVVQPVAPDETAGTSTSSTTQNKNSQQLVIDKVVNRTFEGKSKSYNFYTKVAEKVEAKKSNKVTSTVTLKSIPSNPNAIIMTLNDTGDSEESDQPIPGIDKESDKLRGSETEIGLRGSENKIDVADTAGNVVATKERPKPSISQLCEQLASKTGVIVSASEAQPSPPKPAYARPVRSRNRKSSPRKSVESFVGMKEQEGERKSKTPSPLAQQNVASNEDSHGDDTDFSNEMRQFVADYALDRSWLVHCDLKSLSCKTCEKTFTTPYGLKFHCKMKHVDKMVQYPCPQCKKQFTYFTALARHLRKVHTKSEAYIEFIQSRLKGKLGRRKSLEDLEMEATEAEKSPELMKKNMLALDTGWKKCDKCGKICWKAKSYYRHVQYCKGSGDSSKSSSVDSSPVKTREKGQIKKVTEKVKPVTSEKEENLKEKYTFNENLTIRTRKQAENMTQENNTEIDENMQSSEKNMKSPGITITITEPQDIQKVQKAGELSIDHVDKNEISPIDIEKEKSVRKAVSKDQNVVQTQNSKLASPKFTAANDAQTNVNLTRKTSITMEKKVEGKNYSLETKLADNDSITKALQDALLNFNSNLNTEKEKPLVSERKGIFDSLNTPECSSYASNEVCMAATKGHNKLGTRRVDGTVKEMRKEWLNQTESHSVRCLTISKILMKPVEKESAKGQRRSTEYVKPVTRGDDGIATAREVANEMAKNTGIKEVESPISSEIFKSTVEKQSKNSHTTSGNKIKLSDREVSISEEIFKNTVVSKSKAPNKIPTASKTSTKPTVKEQDTHETYSKEYVKPVTRRSDGTLPLQSNKNDATQNADSQNANIHTDNKINNKPTECRTDSRLNDKEKLIKNRDNKQHVKPVTRATDGTLKDVHDKGSKTCAVLMIASSKSSEKLVVSEESIHDQNISNSDSDKAHKLKDKQMKTVSPIQNDENEENKKTKDRAVSEEMKPVSVKIPGSPNLKDRDSASGSLDSPTWTDNPMLKFKMTVKEMAELVESTSLKKFARERKNIAKQILNKKQNGSKKTIKKKITKKKPIPVVKKVYGTRLSTGSIKSEMVTVLAEPEETGHRYATRNVDAKLASENENKGKADETKMIKDESTKPDKLLKEKASTLKMKEAEELMPGKSITESTKIEEHATLNSKRKEYLAAKRDQRRKFLLANKTASPKKSSPEKVLPTRLRTSKEAPVSLSPKAKPNTKMSLSPGRQVKKLFLNNEASEDSDKTSAEDRRLSLRSQKPVESKEPVAENKVLSDNVKPGMVGNSKNTTEEDGNSPRSKKSRYSVSPEVKQKGIHDLRRRPSSTEGVGSSFMQRSASSERTKTSMQESTSLERPKQFKDNRNSKSDRSKQLKNMSISLEKISHKTQEKFKQSGVTSVNKQHTQVTKTSQIQHKITVNDVPIADAKGFIERVDKEANNDIASKDTDQSDTEAHAHKTRLSTGSLPVSKISKMFETESSATLCSSEEESSELVVTKTNKKRKRYLSAPQEIKPEPKEVKRFSLSTGVIQCQRCGKKFWKKTSYTVHIMKSPCGKKQKVMKNEIPNDTENAKNESSSGKSENVSEEKGFASTDNVQDGKDKSESLESSLKGMHTEDEQNNIEDMNAGSMETDNLVCEESENGKYIRSKSGFKRPLSASPEEKSKPHKSVENFVVLETSKRQKLETKEFPDNIKINNTKDSVCKAAIENNNPDITYEASAIENNNPDITYEAVGKSLPNEDTQDRQETVHKERKNVKMDKMSVEIYDEKPGTSKNFSHEDSDTGSEFSGFCEEDLSYPKLPDELSDYGSDGSGDENNDMKGVLPLSDDNNMSSERELSVEKERENDEKRTVVSVEEIWVGKEPGLPVTEKTKSNRIYVMDTESCRKLHCQDKRNIDSFFEEDSLKCLRCEKEFSSISNLRQHVIRHLGWKRYQCRMCSVFSCYNLSEARMHLPRSHGVHVENDTELKKFIKDLNKEAGKKRSTKRMKTIRKKKYFESPVSKKGSMSKTNMSKQEKSHIDSTNKDENIQGKSSPTDHTSDGGENGLTMLKEHEYSRKAVDGKDDVNGNENLGHIVTEASDCVHVETLNSSASPVKKSVRLAAKEDTRKSAVEILKGPKLPPSPRKWSVSPKSDIKKTGSPQKVNKTATKTTEQSNKPDESPLTKARQMLANILKP